jgi:hypothetical protein
MSHLRNVKIKFNNVHEMRAVRAVLKEFGYPIFAPFESSDSVEHYDCVVIEPDLALSEEGVGRGRVRNLEAIDSLTLEQFIARQAEPVLTPAQKELAKLEAQADALQKQIATLKATI